VQDRLAGVIATSEGTPGAGPGGALDRTAHGRRNDRRRARSWSPEQIAGAWAAGASTSQFGAANHVIVDVN
jgi:hypothetical protein